MPPILRTSPITWASISCPRAGPSSSTGSRSPRAEPSGLIRRIPVMAEPQPAGASAGKLVIRNIGLLLSGDLGQPILDADTIVAVDGRIAAIGTAKEVDAEKATTVI